MMIWLLVPSFLVLVFSARIVYGAAINPANGLPLSLDSLARATATPTHALKPRDTTSGEPPPPGGVKPKGVFAHFMVCLKGRSYLMLTFSSLATFHPHGVLQIGRQT
jgi:hypothetical protein